MQDKLNQLLTDMRCEVVWTDKATMPIPLYERMKEAIKQAMADKPIEPDYFIDRNNWEMTYHDIDMLQDELDFSNEIMRIGRLVSLPDKFMVCITNQETDESEYKLFDTKEEAEAALALAGGESE